MSFTEGTFLSFSALSVARIAVDRMLIIVFPDIKQISIFFLKYTFLLALINLNNIFQAFRLSFLSLLVCAIFSTPVLFITKMHVIAADVSYCYVVSGNHLKLKIKSMLFDHKDKQYF